MHEHINRLLTDFGNVLGLEGLSLDESGYCCLSFDDVVVNIESVGDSSLVLLYSRLGVLTEDAGREIYSRLLEANYFFQETAGATIGLDTATGAVAITRVVDVAAMEMLEWESALKAFVDAAESCSGLLNPEPQETAAPAEKSRFENILRA